MTSSAGAPRGLRPDGTFAREGELSRVQAEFQPVVDVARARIHEEFPPALLHSAYLYGSIPRGAAREGGSDLDLLLALHREPTPEDAARAGELEGELDARFPQIDGAGMLLVSADRLLSERERHDGGWFVACLCTPLLGPDLAGRLPAYRPTTLLARETNGDFGRALPRWRARAADRTLTPQGFRTLARGAARKTVRTGFTLVMPRWRGWTSDLDESAEIFGFYYPGRAGQMRHAARTARAGDTDAAGLAVLTDVLGPV